jgi:hypothetical protein
MAEITFKFYNEETIYKFEFPFIELGKINYNKDAKTKTNRKPRKNVGTI